MSAEIKAVDQSAVTHSSRSLDVAEKKKKVALVLPELSLLVVEEERKRQSEYFKRMKPATVSGGVANVQDTRKEGRKTHRYSAVGSASTDLKAKLPFSSSVESSPSLCLYERSSGAKCYKHRKEMTSRDF